MGSLTMKVRDAESPQTSVDGVRLGALQQCAINCTNGVAPLPDHLAQLVRDSLAPNTKRAYASDLARFTAWGGTVPCSPDVLAEYLAAHKDTHSVASLKRWLTSLAKAHRAIDADDPTRHELVKSVLRGIRRQYASAERQAKPLLRDDLFGVLDGIGSGPKADRDRALLLTGFAGGFRGAPNSSDWM